MSSTEVAREQAEAFAQSYQAILSEVGRLMVGQEHVVRGVVTALLANGHALLEGVPGLGKTLLVRALGRVLELDFARIQFTPDLMPADIVGTTVLHESEGGKQLLQYEAGPVFANLILADEINRATPKTQSALLEAMQERQVTVAGTTRDLPRPFIVLATQNPIEQEGTYPLPEAQLDRFLFKLKIGYPSEAEYHTILERTTGQHEPELGRVCDGARLLEMRDLARRVPVSEPVQSYAVRLAMATQPDSPYAPQDVTRYVALGSSPRGVQGLISAGKVNALASGRFAVGSVDIRDVARSVLRHRVLLNFEGQAEGVDPDVLIEAVLDRIEA